MDGREEEMRDVIWRAVLEWYRECPIKPAGDRVEGAGAEAAYLIYESRVKSRLMIGARQDGAAGARGPRAGPLFWEKWRPR